MLRWLSRPKPRLVQNRLAVNSLLRILSAVLLSSFSFTGLRDGFHENYNKTKGYHALVEMVMGVEISQTGNIATVLMDRYLRGLLDPFITLLELHKLMYFMQEAGEPLRLRYKKAPYGPYAENLRHVLNKIEGHFVAGYADGGDAPEKPLQVVPGAVEEASRFLDAHPETRAHYARVTELVEGFESPFGLELLSTVHWVIKHETPQSREDVLQKTYAWNPRKRQFTPRQINLAVDVLMDKGWVEPFEGRH